MSFENKLPTPLENNDAKGHMVCTLNKTTDARRAAETLSIAFSNSPAFHFISKKILNIPLAEKVPTRTIATDIISPFLDSPYGEISEVNTFDAVAVWSLPPHVPKARSNDAKFNKDFIDDLNARVK
ncbi:CGH_1_collapsed_G0012280.mRNA.1.CDS.1 [Saccharomyces cerevisiae]|nr:CGH_3_collapsed_G0012210.mRNA.1.CDS.1 [Saccharomyces cerevisiae]CAI7222176.1 CGH_1_collapsed_G0012280.mRNA.1.CDS.1 [Saccharomyces cerevisiae]